MASKPGKMTSHGRGGAGNFSRDSASPAPENFVTPTIKSDNYTTGRGGAGNMAKNDDPEEARMAQDVGPAYRGTADKQTHIGRGGAANIAKVDTEERQEEEARRAEVEKELGQKHEGHQQGHAHGGGLHGIVEKGKEMLGSKHH